MSKTTLKTNMDLNKANPLNRRDIERFQYTIKSYQLDQKNKREGNNNKDKRHYD